MQADRGKADRQQRGWPEVSGQSRKKSGNVAGSPARRSEKEGMHAGVDKPVRNGAVRALCERAVYLLHCRLGIVSSRSLPGTVRT